MDRFIIKQLTDEIEREWKFFEVYRKREFIGYITFTNYLKWKNESKP